jgi:hypothetical protein
VRRTTNADARQDHDARERKDQSYPQGRAIHFAREVARKRRQVPFSPEPSRNGVWRCVVDDKAHVVHELSERLGIWTRRRHPQWPSVAPDDRKLRIGRQVRRVHGDRFRGRNHQRTLFLGQPQPAIEVLAERVEAHVGHAHEGDYDAPAVGGARCHLGGVRKSFLSDESRERRINVRVARLQRARGALERRFAVRRGCLVRRKEEERTREDHHSPARN